MRLALSLLAALFVASAPAHAQIVTKYSGIQPVDHPSSYAEKYFGEELGILSKGTIKVEVYHNTQLGDAVANVQSVRNGTIGFTTVSASNLNQVLPAMDMYSLPFLFKNEQHFWWFLAQPQAAELAKQMEDKGIKIIGYHRFRLAQLLHAESRAHARRSQRPEDPRDGLAGDGQHHEVAGRDRRAGGLGGALHRAADRRRGRRGKQPSVRGRQEVLRGVEILHPRRAHAHSGRDRDVDEALEHAQRRPEEGRSSKPARARRPICAARGKSPR